MNKEVCIEMLRRLRGAVKEIAPKCGGTTFNFFLHDNAPTHQSILVKDFLSKKNVTPLELILS